jgi:TatD DNase family protein
VSSKSDPPPLPDPLAAPIVDAHTHLDACGAREAAGVAAMLDRASSVGVSRVVTVADDLASARWCLEASAWDPRVTAAVALHPSRTAGFDAVAKTEIERLAASPGVVAVGETGLDYYWDEADPAEQRAAFRWHIGLAKRLALPLMIHDRDAHEDIMAILDDEGPPETVMLHCFSGDAELASRACARGYLISFAGTVTFRNARALHEAAPLVPAEQLLVETDAPFLTPHPYRGRPNEPYAAAYTLRRLAALRGADEGALARAVTANAERVFTPERHSIG